MRELIPPISQDTDDRRRDRRLRAVERDVILRSTGEPCPGCEQWARTTRTTGGEGCRCQTDIAALIRRCERLATIARETA